MLRKTLVVLTAAALAACASRPPPPPPAAPPPVLISEQAESDSAAEAIPDAPAKPRQTDHGRFRVSVASLDTVAATVPWVSKLEAAGYRTEILEVVIDGRTWQRVLLPGYASLEEARAVIPFVEQELGLSGVWVTSRRRAPVPPHLAAPAAEAAPAPAPAAAEAPPSS
jgi:cell division septation protein DedD